MYDFLRKHVRVFRTIKGFMYSRISVSLPTNHLYHEETNNQRLGIYRPSLIRSARREYPYLSGAKLLQKSEMRKNMVMDLIYRGFINAANYSESHYNPRRSQIKTELRYLFVTTPNR